jgi:hypothetical protein
MEKGPCNVSAQSPPAENIEGNLSVKYDHRTLRMMVIIKTPLLEIIWLIQYTILGFLNCA